MTDELKPCPFCGSTAICMPKGETGYLCRTCGTEGFGDWNTRPIEDKLTAEVERLQGILGDIIFACGLAGMGKVDGLKITTMSQKGNPK